LARVSEVHGLTWRQIRATATHTSAHLYVSKTDPFRKGSTIGVPADIWQLVLSLLPPGPHPPGSPLFPGVTAAAIVAAVGGKGHSLRRGGAQALWDAGVSLAVIKRRARWRSDAWMAYIDFHARDLAFSLD
jgi:hypothetical protein